MSNFFSLYRNNISFKVWFSALFVFVISISISAVMIWHFEKMHLEKAHADAADLAQENVNLLRKSIDQKLALTYPIAALIDKEGNVANFASIGKKLIDFYPAISEIALVPNGVIRDVVPYSTNKKAVGFNLFTDPIQKAEALLARETGEMTLAGPLELVQGGKGLVGRLPVFTKKQEFWGFVLVVIRFPDILDSSSLNKLKKEGYHYTLSRINPATKTEEIIASSEGEEMINPAQKNIDLPNITWRLRIAPIQGWHNEWMIALEGIIAFLLSALFGYIAKQYIELKHYRHFLEKLVDERTAEITKTKNQLDTLLDTIPDLIWLKDKEGIYLLCNPMFERFFGAKEEEIVGKTDYDFVNKELADSFCKNDSIAMNAHAPIKNEEWITFADDGHPALLETVKIPMVDEHHNLIGILGVAHDITERYNNETRIKQLTQMYATLSDCNHAIVHSNTPNELFAKICENIVTKGGMSMAWIGMIDPLTNLITPIASYGDENDYLNGLIISTQADLPTGRGPTGTAARENRPLWCQDFLSDPITTPWHERGKAIGWNASAALPLHLYDDVIGVFTLYSKTLNGFDPLIQELIAEMAMDISFAMENFDREAKRRTAKEHLIQTEKLLEEMSSAAHIGGWKINLESGMAIWTKETSLIYDMDPTDEVTLAIALSVYKGEWLEKAQTALNEIIETRTPRDFELQMSTQKGNEKWVRVIASPIIEDDKVNKIQGSVQDITTQKNAEERVQWLAHYDHLTRLPNRTLLSDRANYAIHIANRAQETLSLLFLDLDHFKNINDSLGHTVGDELLIEVSQRMQSILREEDTLSRQGGDEFIILLPNTDANGAAHTAEKVIDSVSQPYYIQNYEFTITPSIGIALYPIDGNNLETLLQSSDAAMYRAKHDGRNCYRFVTAEIQARSSRNLELENALRYALRRNELEVYYQPQISMESGNIIGAEALLRWNHPAMGMVSPAEFIAVAEESGQIIAIGEWVLRRALEQLKSWISEGMEPFIMAVNLSAIQFRHPTLVSMVLSVLEELELPAAYLELELTEGIAMQNPLHAIEIMNELHAHGVRMSIDDFGTGYSSLNYLKQFKVYKLKIDQSFIRDITNNSEDKTIVNTIINMAHSLNMITIAEGVETAEQLSLLRENGCNEIQGYFYSKPIPAKAFQEYVQQKRYTNV